MLGFISFYPTYNFHHHPVHPQILVILIQTVKMLTINPVHPQILVILIWPAPRYAIRQLFINSPISFFLATSDKLLLNQPDDALRLQEYDKTNLQLHQQYHRHHHPYRP